MTDYTDADYEREQADADAREERRQQARAEWLRGPEGQRMPSDLGGDDASD